MGQELLARLRLQVGLLRDYFAKRRVIHAVQIWIWTVFALAPTKVLIRRCCFRALKNSSICQRCW